MKHYSSLAIAAAFLLALLSPIALAQEMAPEK